MRRLSPCVCVSKYKPHKMVIIKLNYNKYTTTHTQLAHTHIGSRATVRVLSVIDLAVFSTVVELSVAACLPAPLLLLCATVRMIIIVIIVGLQVMRSCSTLLMTFLCKMTKTLRFHSALLCGCGLLWFVNICSPSFICL